MTAVAKAEALENLSASVAEIERALLGACMTYPTASEAALTVLEPAHFSEPVHAAIWSTTTSLVAEGRPVTVNRHAKRTPFRG